MSEIRVNNITNRDGTAGPSIAGIPVVDSNSHLVVPTGRTGQRYADGGENIVRDGLVLYLDAKYSYPGATGTNPDVYTWYDLSGNENNGELKNGVSYSATDGGSLVFDGSNDIVLCGNSSTVQITDKITLSGFIKPLSTSINVDSLVCKWSGTADQRAYFFGIGNSKVWFALSSNGLGGYPELFSTTSVSTNTWYYISSTWDKSTGEMKIYINGQLDATRLNVTNSIFNSNKQLSIGSEDGGYVPVISKNIAQVQVYNRALSASEVLQNYNALKSRFGI
jgi:hypothetical protein